VSERLARPLVWVAIVTYAAVFASLSVLRYRGFESGRFDLGNMVQAVWSTAHGHPLRVTNLHGEQVSRLAAHFDPILVVFAPFWRLWPHPSLLLATQAIAIALGALPVFRLARKHLDSERAALGFALAYLLYPATQWLTLNEFHPVALACPLLLFALWYLDEERLLLFGGFAAVACLTKEEIPLVVAGMGVWYAISRRRWLLGSAIAVGGVVISAAAIKIVIPHFHGAESHFFGRYRAAGGSAAGIAKKAVTDPGRLLSLAFDHRGVHYLLDLALPLAALSVLGPLVLIAALPELVLNLLSSAETQSSIHYHYTAGEIPALVAAAIFGAKRLGRHRNLAAGTAVVATIVGNFFLGPLPIWRFIPGGETLQANAAHISGHDRAATRALKLIPREAAVTATNSLGAHLSQRQWIFSFPFVDRAQWVIVDERKPSVDDQNDKDKGLELIKEFESDRRFRRVYAEDGVLVYRRR
jgi:uncharacterized membrane protein